MTRPPDHDHALDGHLHDDRPEGPCPMCVVIRERIALDARDRTAMAALKRHQDITERTSTARRRPRPRLPGEH